MLAKKVASRFPHNTSSPISCSPVPVHVDKSRVGCKGLIGTKALLKGAPGEENDYLIQIALDQHSEIIPPRQT